MSIVPIEDQRQKSWDNTALARRVIEVDSDGNSVSETVFLLRRIAKLLEASATQDVAQRQRVIVDGAVITSGTITTVGTVTTVANANLIAGNDGRYLFMENARLAYAQGIRNNLSW